MVLALIVAMSAAFPAPRTRAAEEPKREDAQTQDNAAAESESIRRLIATYTESIDKADTNLASKIWLNSPEATFIHPMSHERGFEQIEQNFYGHVMGETFSERKLTAKDISIHVRGDCAWSEFYWDFVAKFRKDGSPITTHGRESQVYYKQADGWRLVHVHYSGMPLSGRQGF